MSLEPVRLVGGTGSPYTQKMVACCVAGAFPTPLPGASPRQPARHWGSRRPNRPLCPPSFLRRVVSSLLTAIPPRGLHHRPFLPYGGRSR